MTIAEWQREVNSFDLWKHNLFIGCIVALIFILIVHVLPTTVMLIKRLVLKHQYKLRCKAATDALEQDIETPGYNAEHDPVDCALMQARYEDATEIYNKLCLEECQDWELATAKVEMESARKDLIEYRRHTTHPKPEMPALTDDSDFIEISKDSFELGFGFGVLILCIFFFIGMFKAVNYREELRDMSIDKEYIQDIYCMDLQNEVSGSGSFRHIKISTDSYYYFYTKTYSGAYTLSKVEVGSTVLLETTDTPALYRYKPSGSFEIKYILYVPEGTVVTAGFSPF